MPEFAATQPHGKLEEIFPNIFVVRGSISFMPLFSIARNMTVVRNGDELTVFNSVRLDDAGEKELEKLGKVKHVVKLGFFHGIDDPYYRERYKATYWVARPKPDTNGASPLASGPASFSEGEIFTFEKGDDGEAAFIAPREGGNVLITCDSVQNWTDTKGCSAAGAVFMKFSGFIEPAKIGPFWIKKITKDPKVMKGDFERLLEKDFDRILSGHGTPMKSGGKEALKKSVARTFAAKS